VRFSEPLRVALVGPLPPPVGGMANQTLQLAERLCDSGLLVEVIQVNAPYAPRWVGKLRGVRALFRLLPYLLRLRRAAGSADLLHVMANSGWSWYLFAAPAIWIGAWKNRPVLVNYRGGEAEAFFRRAFRRVGPSLRKAAVIVVPTPYLRDVFASFGIVAEVIPNAVDGEVFFPAGRSRGLDPHLAVPRNLEAIYDNATAIRALATIRQSFPQARMTIAGAGPLRAGLEDLAESLGLGAAVRFAGTLDRLGMAGLYRSADLCLNPSLADAMPNSLLEALACGVPVVSTDVGGIPAMLEDRDTAMLVRPADPAAMAAAAVQVLKDPDLYAKLRRNGLEVAGGLGWREIGPRWMAIYRQLIDSSGLQADPKSP
jgi:L-malate glycosyltransferase